MMVGSSMDFELGEADPHDRSRRPPLSLMRIVI